jgi:cobalt-zinc-cadmium efflux system protein
MGLGHDHAHHHDHRTAAGQHRGRLAVVLGVSVSILIVELVGGLVTGSLALLADAGHMFTDAAGVALALGAATLAGRPATAKRTFGWQRAEVLAAVANAVLLFGIGAFIVIEAVERLVEPPPVAAGAMLVYALIALVANTGSVLLLARGKDESLNVRGAYLEVLSDAIGAGAVVIASLVIAVTGFRQADALASMAIGLLILPRTWRLLREALDVLIEATPPGVDLEEVRRHLLAVREVVDVHDLHAWTITSGVPVISAHIVVDQNIRAVEACDGRILDQLGACLGGHFDIEHCTFQLEPVGHAAHELALHP